MRTLDVSWYEIELGDVAGLEDSIASLVEGWYLDEPLGDDFVNRLEGWLPSVDGRKGALPEQMDDPVVRAILKSARAIKRELNGVS